MSLVGKLIGFGLRQVLGEPAAKVAAAVEKRFRDQSQTLPQALERAADRAWQTLGIALAGDGLLDRVKVLFASGDDKGIREQVAVFLKGNALSFDGRPAEFRQTCLNELKALRKSGLLSTAILTGSEVARHAAGFKRQANPQKLIEEANRALVQVADALPPGYPNLAILLRTPTESGPPLLAAAFAYFFRREVETNDELAHGLLFDGLRQLSAEQAKAFGEVGKALVSLGNQFDALFEQLGRIEAAVVQTQETAAAVHVAVLDLQAEMQQLGGLHLAKAEEVRALLMQVQQHLAQAGMQRGEVRPQNSLSIRGEDERRAVKALLARFRALPAEESRRAPALLNGLGKLQIGAGDFAEARETFAEVAQVVADPTAKAEASYNTYRAGLEERKWDAALEALTRAAGLAAARFAPFPMNRYRPQRILGAGGFGTAFLCQDTFFRGREVVVKALHPGDMARGVEEVFAEAHALSELNHPAIIGVLDCSYADLAGMSRPYIVMPYFAGGSLEQFVEQRGTLTPEQMVVVALQIARGMQAAHERGILHRDLKPANILVRKEGEHWRVKIIDFGLALRRDTVETSAARTAKEETLLSRSAAGTVQYAPPEQMGRLPGVKVGPHSDVFAFGKTCCYALFKTTEPRSRHLARLPDKLRELLEKCMEQELDERHATFHPVIDDLATLKDGKTSPPVTATSASTPCSESPPPRIQMMRMMYRKVIMVPAVSVATYASIKLIPTGGWSGGTPSTHHIMVVDVSGGMYREDGTGISRLRRIQQAIIKSIHLLKPQDYLSLIAFAHNAQVVLPSTSLADRANIEAAVWKIDMSEVDPGGNNMAEGLALGLSEAEKHAGRSELSELYCLTNGETSDEAICRQRAQQIAQKKIRLNVIGVGTEWNQHLIKDLAKLSEGDWGYIDVNDATAADKFFKSEFASLCAPGFHNVEMHLRPVKGVQIARLWKVAASIKEVIPTRNVMNHLTVSLGTLEREIPTDYLLELTLPKRSDGKYVVASVEVSFDPGTGMRETTGEAHLDITYSSTGESAINPEPAKLLDLIRRSSGAQER